MKEFLPQIHIKPFTYQENTQWPLWCVTALAPVPSFCGSIVTGDLLKWHALAYSVPFQLGCTSWTWTSAGYLINKWLFVVLERRIERWRSEFWPCNRIFAWGLNFKSNPIILLNRIHLHVNSGCVFVEVVWLLSQKKDTSWHI